MDNTFVHLTLCGHGFVVRVVTGCSGSCFRNQFAGSRLVSPTSGCPFKSPFTTGRTYLSLKIRKILTIDSLFNKWIPLHSKASNIGVSD
ncbi:LOW QUALITY PROTEIN: hypothetical protein V1478_007518 [Vespula squamosa]|uniref:Uncharacterized protein n=1 Tax=Vespula squamosa TaxID=30214 RepID=A0ABD2B3G8_VESSQ